MILRIREGEVRDNQADHVTWRRKVAIYVSNYKHEAIRVTYKLLRRLKMMSRYN